jgi:uncharacterized protein YhaN
MHIHRLRLHAYGHFEDKLLTFAEPGKLSLVYGANEAGKSTALYALEAFLFGLMDKRVAVTYEQAWSKSKLKVTGWLSAQQDPEALVELQRSGNGVLDRHKTGAEAWLPAKGQRGLFKDLFALDGERLRAEAGRALAAGGSANEALGAALLGEHAEQQCKRLEAELEALYKPRGRTQTINALRAELEALDKAISEQALSAQDWLGQDRAAKEAQRKAETLEAERQAVSERQAVLVRDAQRLKADDALARLEAQLAALQDQHPGLPLLSDADLQELEALERDRSTLSGAVAQRQSELEQLERQGQSLSLDAGLWQGHESAQASLGQGYEAASLLLHAWRALQATKPAALQQAAPADQSADQSADQRAQQIAQDEGLAQHQDRLEALADQAGALPPLADEPQAPTWPTSLAPLVGEGGLPLTSLEALLAPERNLAGHSQRWAQEHKRLRQEAQELVVEQRASQRSLEEAAIACQHLQNQGAGLEPGPLTEARRQRDRLWSQVKRDPSAPLLQAELEEAIFEVDRLADVFARSERQAGAWQHAQRQQAEAQLKVSAAQARAKTLSAQDHDLGRAVAKALAAGGLQADDLASEALLALVEAVLGCQERLEAWRQDCATWQAAQARWRALAEQAEALGYQGDPARPLDRGLRTWLKEALEAARAAQRRLEQGKQWQGWHDQEAGLSSQVGALLAQAEAQGLARLFGQGLEPTDRLILLAEAFEHERKQRQEQARLGNEIARQRRALDQDQARLAALDEQRRALVPDALTDLALLHSASNLQTQRVAQFQARAVLGVCEAWQDLSALEDERAALDATYQALDGALQSARQAAGEQRQALRALQQRDGARDLRFERAAALERLRQATRQYLDLGLQARVLRGALNGFLEQQQDALLAGASRAFERLTDGAYRQLDQRRDGEGAARFWVSDELGDDKALDQLSEGTKDQLYLSLRLAALDQYGLGQLATDAGALPLICDDLLVQFDDARAARALALLAERRERQQVIYFTHHKHLLELAAQHLPPDSFQALDLSSDQ